jgi:hypothetical protein
MTHTMDQGRDDGSERGPEKRRGIRRGTSDVLMTQKRDQWRTHKHGNESSDSTKSAEFFDQLSEYHHLKNAFAYVNNTYAKAASNYSKCEHHVTLSTEAKWPTTFHRTARPTCSTHRRILATTTLAVTRNTNIARSFHLPAKFHECNSD